MEKLSLNDIRSEFLNFFKNQDHHLESSSSLIPSNDPTLMFTNSGMVQFKNLFTGLETRTYTKAATSQKCVRAGGKHNDLENVGYTARHHTFFEMLGNFSFGDYFKEEAIFYAWEVLTKVYKLPPEKLYITIYHNDEEAYKYWKKLTSFSDDKIIRIDTKDNFWSMGEAGPCGPCSEIFYDHGEKIFGGLPGSKDGDGDRYIEIWNLVFMQFEQLKSGEMIALPKQSIDTGMGIERLTAILQNVHDVYDIDIFKNLIRDIADVTNTNICEENKFSHRIIADHIRSCVFLIADGIIPSNEGRGYVLRRIMRRAMRHFHLLGVKESVMYKLVSCLANYMGGFYPQIKQGEAFISEIIKYEEDKFKDTLDKGLKLLNNEIKHLPKGNKIEGEVAFKLYDTYGFPLDLTEDIIKPFNIEVDIEGFNKSMENQKALAKKHWVGSGADAVNNIWFTVYEKFGASEFLGYTHENLEAKIVALITDNKQVEKVKTTGQNFILIANQTPFYGEAGGQLGDIGHINGENFKIRVTDTKKYLGKLIAHFCILEEGEVQLEQDIYLEIDREYRKELKAHHSATHLLHSVLRNMLGTHVTQKGSLVASSKLRFDFSHLKPLTREQIKEIEDLVNNIILDNHPVVTKIMQAEEAINAGAMALFGEKYEEEVRVVSMGSETISIELCGGTHVKATGEIGMFKITQESGIASGIRRIEAVVSKATINLFREKEAILENLSANLKCPEEQLLERTLQLNMQKKNLETEVFNLQKRNYDYDLPKVIQESIIIGEIKLFIKVENNINDIKLIRQVVESIVKKFENVIMIFIVKNQDKLNITTGVSANLANFDAREIIKLATSKLGGEGGGGSKNIAQGGGSNISKLKELESELVRYIENI